MTTRFHERVKRVFYEASQRLPAERAAYLQEICGNAHGVRAEVESLLGFHREPGTEALPREEAGRRTRRHFRRGRVLGGRYRIEALLGRGGTGAVYRAWDLALDIPVSLKVLLVSNGLARAELVREVRLACQVTHPAVCRVYDIHEEEGEAFLTMEWIDGEHLAALLERKGRLAPSRALRIARELCSGLSAAHEKGIVHRDVKPGNVLIDCNGGAHLTDFGAALALGRPSLGDLLPIGTPRYMAPEQLQEGGEVTPRTDVYALGLVLHEMLSGLRPRPGRRPTTLRPERFDLEPGLVEVIERAVSRDPLERFASAAQMGRALSLEPQPNALAALSRPRDACRAWAAAQRSVRREGGCSVGLAIEMPRPREALAAHRLQAS